MILTRYFACAREVIQNSFRILANLGFVPKLNISKSFVNFKHLKGKIMGVGQIVTSLANTSKWKKP